MKFTTPEFIGAYTLPGATAIVVLTVTIDNAAVCADRLVKIFDSITDEVGVIRNLHLFIAPSTVNSELQNLIHSLYILCDEEVKKKIKKITVHLYYSRLRGKNEPNRYTTCMRSFLDKKGIDKLSSWVTLDGSQYNEFSLDKGPKGKRKPIPDSYISISYVYIDDVDIPFLCVEYSTKSFTCKSYINGIEFRG